MTISTIIQTYYPIMLFVFMIVVCLVISAKKAGREDRPARKVKSTKKIDKVINNSNSGIDAMEYAKFLTKHNIRYLAWRARDDGYDQ